MDNNMVLNNGFNELIFENRHKEYGAYQIRKRYKRNVLIASLISISILCSGMVLYFANLPDAMAAVPKFRNDIVTIGDIKSNTDPVKPKEPVKPKTPPPAPKGPNPAVLTNPVITTKPVETIRLDSSGTNPKGIVNGIGNPLDTAHTGGCTNCDTVASNPPPPERVTWTPDSIYDPGLDPFFKKNIKYPEMAKERNIQGIVWLEFVVDVYGNTKEYKIIKSPDALLSNEVMRVAPKMPRFRPVTFKGVPVEYIFRKPVRFTLGN